MAQTIPLDVQPNQELTVRLDDFRYVLRFKEAAGVMVVDVTRDGVVLLEASRVLAGEPLIPYKWMEGGNFILTTEDDELPDWQQFGVTQTLVYLTVAEVGALGG
jgi:hypothetical protein